MYCLRAFIGFAITVFSGTATAKRNWNSVDDFLGMAEATAIENSDQDYHDRYEAVTGSSLWACPVCKRGRMMVVGVIDRLTSPLPDTSWQYGIMTPHSGFNSHHTRTCDARREVCRELNREARKTLPSTLDNLIGPFRLMPGYPWNPQNLAPSSSGGVSLSWRSHSKPITRAAPARFSPNDFQRTAAGPRVHDGPRNPSSAALT